MKRLLLIALVLTCYCSVRGQTVGGVAFALSGDTVRISYSLDEQADICVRVAVAGGRYTEPLKGFTGDVGKSVAPGRQRLMQGISIPEIKGVDSSDLSFLVEVDDGALLVYAGSQCFRMLPVEGGRFTMGCTHKAGEKNTYSDELPLHQVTVNNFYLGRHEVTQGLWKEVMGENPSKWEGNDSLPVEQVSWNEAQIFIARLSQMTGYRFRLPTEAEWEYAARGGKRSRGSRYPGTNASVWSHCWFVLNSDGHTHPVGRLLPNELGFYDMGGNVMEWCADWMAPYTAQPQNCPQGPRKGENRILRGGCINSPSWGCSVFERSWYVPDYGYPYYGFRLALDTPERDEE